MNEVCQELLPEPSKCVCVCVCVCVSEAMTDHVGASLSCTALLSSCYQSDEGKTDRERERERGGEGRERRKGSLADS